MKEIESLIAQKPNEQLVTMSDEASTHALEFEKSLRDGQRWGQDTEKNILAKLDEIAATFPALDLNSAFLYKGIVKVAAQYFQSSYDMQVAQRFLDRVVGHCLFAQGEIVKAFGQKDLPEERRLEFREFQMLLLDMLSILENTSGLVADKRLLKPLVL
jgi:hypothetical protein